MTKTDEELVTDARYLIAHPLMHFSTPEAREILAACVRTLDRVTLNQPSLNQRNPDHWDYDKNQPR